MPLGDSRLRRLTSSSLSLHLPFVVNGKIINGATRVTRAELRFHLREYSNIYDRFRSLPLVRRGSIPAGIAVEVSSALAIEGGGKGQMDGGGSSIWVALISDCAVSENEKFNRA